MIIAHTLRKERNVNDRNNYHGCRFVSPSVRIFLLGVKDREIIWL